MSIIPGQSLTAEPKNAPYENPPEMNDPDEVLSFYIKNLQEEDRLESLIELVEMDYPISELTEGLLRGGVLDGRHSIDVSLLVGATLHAHIVALVMTEGVEDFVEFEDNPEEVKGRENATSMYNRRMVDKAKAKLKKEEKGEYDEYTPLDDDELEVEVKEDIKEEKPTPPAGLMARRSMYKGEDL